MNSLNFKTVKHYTNTFLRAFVFAFFFFVQVKVHAQAVPVADTENKDAITAPKSESKMVVPTNALIVRPAEASAKKRETDILRAIRDAVQPVEPTNQIVILNTEKGFIPDKVRVKKGEAYKVHVVNINMREKNVSFIMDSFTQAHNTVFAAEKSFNIEPQIEGIYSYQCPETGVQGQLIVVDEARERKTLTRRLASEEATGN